MIVGKRDGKRNPGKKCPNAKKRLPAGQTGNINQKCFRSVPREAAFLRLDGADWESEEIYRIAHANILFL